MYGKVGPMEELSLNAREDFEKVLGRYNKMVYRLAYSRTQNCHDADDVLQEVFLRYVKCGKIFNDEEHRKAWLIRITINCSKSLVTNGWRKHTTDDEITDDTEGVPDRELELYDTKTAVYDAVMQLPVKYRTVVHLFYYEDLPISAVCEATGASETAVKTQLHRARGILKEKLKGVEFDA